MLKMLQMDSPKSGDEIVSNGEIDQRQWVKAWALGGWGLCTKQPSMNYPLRARLAR